MTNEEAIKAIKANYPSGGYERLCEALDMAIESLKHIPCYLDSPCEYQNPDIKIPHTDCIVWHPVLEQIKADILRYKAVCDFRLCRVSYGLL